MPGLPPIQTDEAVLCAFLARGHWALLKVTREDDLLHAVCYDGIPGRSMQDAQVLLTLLARCMTLQLGQLVEASFGLQQEPCECGVVALAHASFLLQTADAPFFVHRQWAKELLHQFPPLPGLLFGAGGLSEQQHLNLANLLQAKGVPADQVQERIKAAVKKLGVGSVAQALQEKNPWQALKACAS